MSLILICATLVQIGNTPLHYACAKSHLTLATILLEHGADTNAANKVRVDTIKNVAESFDISFSLVRFPYPWLLTHGVAVYRSPVK
jgi:ankyrin repeat protein